MLSIGSFQNGHVEYIPWIFETFHMAYQVINIGHFPAILMTMQIKCKCIIVQKIVCFWYIPFFWYCSCDVYLLTLTCISNYSASFHLCVEKCHIAARIVSSALYPRKHISNSGPLKHKCHSTHDSRVYTVHVSMWKIIPGSYPTRYTNQWDNMTRIYEYLMLLWLM